MSVYVVLAAAAIVGSVPLAWWALASGRESRAGLVARNLPTGGGGDLRRELLARSARERAIEPAVLALAGRARRMTPAGMLASLEHKLALASEQWPLERLLAAKLGLALATALVGLLLWISDPSPAAAFFVLALVVIAYLVPDMVVGRRARQRQDAIRTQLSGTLDQISISVEAGLGFEAALARVGQTGTGPLAEELLRTLQDIRLGVPRRGAMERLVERTDVDDLGRFVHAMRQAEGYGIPIAQVLRVQAAELRDKRRQHAEEQAMKLSVKLVFPVIFCILPALFLVVLGPVVVRFVQGELLPT